MIGRKRPHGGKRRRRGGPVHKRTPRRLGEYQHNTTNGIRTEKK